MLVNFNGRNNQRVIGSMVSSGSSRVCRVTVGRSCEEDIYVWDTGGEARSLAKRHENIRKFHANQRCIHVTIVYVTRKLIRFMGSVSLLFHRKSKNRGVLVTRTIRSYCYRILLPNRLNVIKAKNKKSEV